MGGATWGLYIVFDIYFVGVSFAGLTVVVLIRFFNLRHLRPVERMAQALTVVAVLLSGVAVAADLGQPGRGIINLFRYARPESPFFGTVTLVTISFLAATMTYLYLGGRRDAALLAREPSRLRGFFRLWAAGYQDTPEERERYRRTTFWAALMVLPLLVLGLSTQGFVFGVQGGAAGWFSALQPPMFLVLAGVSAFGHIILVAAAARWLLNLQRELPLPVFAWLGNTLALLVLVSLYLIATEALTAGYSAREQETALARAMLTGDYAWLFWSVAGLFVLSFAILFIQMLAGRVNVGLLVLAAVLVNIAAIGKRFLIVVPSQTHGRLLPYEVGTYAPTWVEYSVVVGLLALGALIFVAFFRLFPIVEIALREEGE
jgi:molybdopterin-containing oxidoreductase family membrane subunit